MKKNQSNPNPPRPAISVTKNPDPKTHFEKDHPIEIRGLTHSTIRINLVEMRDLIGKLITAEWAYSDARAAEVKSRPAEVKSRDPEIKRRMT